MKFKPVLLGKILAGQKTQTRRWVPTQYRVGGTYSINPPHPVHPHCNGPSAGRIRITAVREQRLGDLTEADARAEGFTDAAAFFAYWRGLYGDVDLGQPVVALTFELVQPESR